MRRKRCIRKERVEENAESDRWLSVTRKQTWCEADSASCSENGSGGHGRVYLTRMRCNYADLLLRGPFCAQKRIQRCVECEYTEFMLTNYFGNTPLVQLAIARSSAEDAVLDRKHWGDQPRWPIICFDSPVTEIFINNPGFVNWSATVCGSSVILEFFEQTLMPWVWTCVSYTLRVLLKRPYELLSYSLCPWDISKA